MKRRQNRTPLVGPVSLCVIRDIRGQAFSSLSESQSMGIAGMLDGSGAGHHDRFVCRLLQLFDLGPEIFPPTGVLSHLAMPEDPFFVDDHLHRDGSNSIGGTDS